MGEIIKIILGILGFVTGVRGGSAEAGPQLTQGAFNVAEKFSGLLFLAGVAYWLFVNKEPIAHLNALELVGIVLLANLMLKVDPPDKI